MAKDEFFQVSTAAGSPQTLKPLDPSAEGRWRAAELNGEPAGLVWTDATDGVGFFPYDGEKHPAAKTAQSLFMTFIRGCLSSGLDASAVFTNFEQLEGATLGEETSGLLSKVVIAAQSAPKAVTAAAEGDDAELQPDDEINVIVNDEEKVTDVALISPRGTFVRENGDWVELSDEDDRIDGLEWIEATPAVLDAFDNASSELTRDDVVPFAVSR